MWHFSPCLWVPFGESTAELIAALDSMFRGDLSYRFSHTSSIGDVYCLFHLSNKDKTMLSDACCVFLNKAPFRSRSCRNRDKCKRLVNVSQSYSFDMLEQLVYFYLSGFIVVDHTAVVLWQYCVCSPRGVEPYDSPTTVLVQRHKPQGVSSILSSTDFFQSEENRHIILERVDSFQLRDKYMFATTTRVRSAWWSVEAHTVVMEGMNNTVNLLDRVLH